MASRFSDLKDAKLPELRRLWLVLLGLVIIIAIGTIGYTLIWSDYQGQNWIDALYMTIITLSTVGYGEIHKLTPVGRIFTIIIILAGFSLFAIGLSITSQVIIEGTLRNIFGRRRMLKEIDKLRDHYIICGYGRIGSLICREISRMGKKLVVIEGDQDTAQRAMDNGFLTIIGDATEDAILSMAGIQRAKALVATVSSDAANVFVTLSAKNLRKDLFVLARATQERSETKLKMAGADKVLSPYTIGGVTMANALLRPNVYEFVEMTTTDNEIDLRIESVEVDTFSSLAKVRIVESNIRQNLGIIILTIIRADGSKVHNPSHDTMILPGDTLIALGTRENLDRLEAIAKGEEHLPAMIKDYPDNQS